MAAPLPDAMRVRPGLLRACGAALTADYRASTTARADGARCAAPDSLDAALCRMCGPCNVIRVPDLLRCVTARARNSSCPPERGDGFRWLRGRKADDVPPFFPVPEASHER